MKNIKYFEFENTKTTIYADKIHHFHDDLSQGRIFFKDVMKRLSNKELGFVSNCYEKIF